MKCPAQSITASLQALSRAFRNRLSCFTTKPSLVICCGRICLGPQENQFEPVLAGQAVGVKEVDDGIWLVSFMDYDLGYFDLDTRVLEPIENPFGPKVLPM